MNCQIVYNIISVWYNILNYMDGDRVMEVTTEEYEEKKETYFQKNQVKCCKRTLKNADKII